MTSPSTAEPERTAGTSPRAREDAELLLRRLAPREARALARLAAGDDLRATARHLGVAPGTARTHLNRAIRKLGVRNREEAVALLATLAPGALEALVAPESSGASGAPAAPPEPEAEPATAPVEFVGPPLPPAEPGPGEPGLAAPAPAPADFGEFAALVHARLVQQTFLLTGHRHRAAHCVHLALGSAARRWAEVAAGPDPEGRVRREAFDLALSPWHRGGPRRAHLLRWPRRRIVVDPAGAPEPPEPPQKLTRQDRALVKALLRLSRPRRRALVLHDTLGLSAERVAVEVESSTAAAGSRVRSARAELAREVPALVGADPEDPEFAERLSALLHRAAVHGCPGPRLPSTARLVADSRLHTGLVTGAAAALTVAVGGVIVAALLGVGPSEPAPPEPVRETACVPSGPAGPDGAGPVAPDRSPGLRSPWCSLTPGVPARLVGPPGQLPPPLERPAPNAPGADPLSAGPLSAGPLAPPPERHPLPPPAAPCGPVCAP
ncbi:LuxR C-terminal-related transcriptional regulator [Kitasatospora phosalacinea]|uniref:LuxR C-terminal-related transcriptional regulator n=1 Tax=Kitasatospora phosalacinea TaxID=2065 RepID=UPI00068FD71E|nr:LuxR C-terminal-related transcriptional regulator [Kitasatospora phosalacinea]